VAELLINTDEVSAAFLDCLYSMEETGNYMPADAVVVKGILGKYGFHPARLEANRARVAEWLVTLPNAFRSSASDGWGWTFLKACYQENGVQWTSFHRHMEQLFCLGLGLGPVRSTIERRYWPYLAGGMPYYVINL